MKLLNKKNSCVAFQFLIVKMNAMKASRKAKFNIQLLNSIQLFNRLQLFVIEIVFKMTDCMAG